jgi:hypothetical protein
MSALILAFPSRAILPRVAIEDATERMIDLLDHQGRATVDTEPDTNGRSSNDGDAEGLPEWHRRPWGPLIKATQATPRVSLLSPALAAARSPRVAAGD